MSTFRKSVTPEYQTNDDYIKECESPFLPVHQIVQCVKLKVSEKEKKRSSSP
jgi:hypothetical protein